MSQKNDKNVFPSAAVILLNWNNFPETEACLRSMREIDYPNYQVIVVDNGSEDDSVEKLAKIKDIILIKSKKNLGFAGGNNLAIKFAIEKNFDYILLLNNDTIVEKSFLSALIDAAEKNQHIGIVGPKIYIWNSDKKLWGAGGGISRFLKRTYHFGENKYDRGQFDEKREVDFVSGCCMLIKRNVFEKIGALDEIYFMYYEDVDFCLRAADAGFRVLYEPKSVIWHKVSVTTNRAQRDFYRMRGYVILLKKIYKTGLLKIILLSFIAIKERALRIIARWLISRGTEKFLERLNRLLAGFLDGFIISRKYGNS